VCVDACVNTWHVLNRKILTVHSPVKGSNLNDVLPSDSAAA